MPEKTADNETFVRQDAPGEDWLNGRQAYCGRCGGKNNKPTIAWDNGEGCVRCSECVYINPDATREAVLYLMEQRRADAEVIKADQQRLDKIAAAVGYEGMGDDDGLLPFVKDAFARAKEKQAETYGMNVKLVRELETAKAKIDKQAADLKEARAKPKTAKVEDKPADVKPAEKADEKAAPEAVKE